MKTRMILIALAFMFLVVSVPLSVFSATNPSPMPTITLTSEPAGKEEAVMEKKPDYLLPYPGILPDHPLYFLKQIRDGIMDRLIVDPLRKAEFHVLQADKRLNMGIVLIEQGKEILAETTISKGEKYMERAVSGLLAFKSTGRPVPASLIDKLTRSMEKHLEILEKTNFTGTIGFVKNLQSEMEKLK